MEETIKYEANLPQLPETTEIELFKMKGSGKLSETSGEIPTNVDLRNVTATITTTTPPPINILGSNTNIRTQYVKKKDIGHGLKQSLQQSEVKNLSVIAEEVECMHSSRNSAINSSKSSSASSSASSSTTNCKLADEPLMAIDNNDIRERIKELEEAAAVAAAQVGNDDNTETTSVDETLANMKEADDDDEMLDDEKDQMLVSGGEIYEKDTLIYI